MIPPAITYFMDSIAWLGLPHAHSLPPFTFLNAPRRRKEKTSSKRHVVLGSNTSARNTYINYPISAPSPKTISHQKIPLTQTKQIPYNHRSTKIHLCTLCSFVARLRRLGNRGNIMPSSTPTPTDYIRSGLTHAIPHPLINRPHSFSPTRSSLPNHLQFFSSAKSTLSSHPSPLDPLPLPPQKNLGKLAHLESTSSKSSTYTHLHPSAPAQTFRPLPTSPSSLIPPP